MDNHLAARDLGKFKKSACMAGILGLLVAQTAHAITCPANSTEDRLVWDNVWTGANSNQVGVDQTFTSESGEVDFVINTTTIGQAGCNNSQFLLYDRDNYYGALIPGQGDTLSIHMDWPNRDCQVRFRVNAFLTGTSTPFDLFRLEYSLYDVDVLGTSAPFPWLDLIRYDPAPANRFNGAGSAFIQASPTTTEATINNCTNANLANLERCRQTVSWDGPLNEFSFNYESGDDAPANPSAQRIFISDIEFCAPDRPDLNIVKEASPDPVRVGQELVYTLTMTNTDPSANAIAAELEDTLPAGLTWISTTNSNGGGTCTVSNLAVCNCSLPGNTGDVTCQMGDFAPSQSKTVVITTRVD